MMNVELREFFQLCKQGKTAKVLALIKYGIDVNIHEYPTGNTPLHISAREGHVTLALKLLEYGADVNALNEYLQTPLIIAMVDLGFFVKSEMIQLLIDKGANVNSRDKDNISPLYRSLTCSMEIRSMLLLKGATDDMYDWNSLHYATKFVTTEKTILELTKKGISVNDVCSMRHPLDPMFVRKSTPLHFLLTENKHGQWDSTCYTIIKDLLAEGANVNAENELKETPLLLACKAKFSDSVVKLLYEHGAYINKESSSYIPPLTLACKNNNTNLAKLHLSYEADVNASDDLKHTPLMWAIFNVNKELVELVLAAGCDIDALSRFGGSFIPAVNIALMEKQFDILELLIKRGAKITSLYNEGSSLLHHVVARKNLNLVTLLLKHMPGENSVVNQQNINGLSPLHLACLNPQDLSDYLQRECSIMFDSHNVEIIKHLLSAGGNVNVVDNFGYTPLLYAVEAGQVELAEILLQNGAHTEVHSDSGWYPIHIAIWISRTDILECLIKYGCNINARIEFARYDAELQNINTMQLACHRLSYNAAKVLLEKGGEMEDSKTGKSAMINIIGSGNENKRTEMFQLLLSYGANIHCTDTNGDSLLHLACQYKLFDLSNDMIKAGVNVHALNNLGQSVIHCALDKKYARLPGDYSNYFPWKLSDNDIAEQRRDFHTVEENHVKVIEGLKHLLEIGVDVNHKDKSGDLALHTCLKRSLCQNEMLDLLFQYGTLVNEKNSEGKRPLDLAFAKTYINKSRTKAQLNSQLYHLEILLSNNADYEYMNNDDKEQSLLHWAIRNNLVCVVYKLLSSGCDVNVRGYCRDWTLIPYNGPFPDKNPLELVTTVEYNIIFTYKLVPALLLAGCSVHGNDHFPHASLYNAVKSVNEFPFPEVMHAFMCLLSAGVNVPKNIHNMNEDVKRYHYIYHPKTMITKLLTCRENIAEIFHLVDIMLECGIKPNVKPVATTRKDDDIDKIIIKIRNYEKQVPSLARQAANVVRPSLIPNAWASVDQLEIPEICKQFITIGKNKIVHKYYGHDAWLTAFRKLLQRRNTMTYKDADAYYNDIDDEDYLPEFSSDSPCSDFCSNPNSPSYSNENSLFDELWDGDLWDGFFS